MIHRLQIPGRPVAKARARRGRGGRWFTPKTTRVYEEEVAWACRALGLKIRNTKVDLHIDLRSHTPLAGDPDNYVKSILDGMVKGELLEDDSWKQIAAVTVTAICNPVLDEQAVVLISPMEDDRSELG